MGVEREFVEQELFRYQNMSKLPDGKSKTEEVFRRVMGDMTEMPLPDVSSQLFIPEARAATASALATPPAEDDDSSIGVEDESRFQRDVAALWSKAMANLTGPPGPPWSALGRHPGLQSRTTEGSHGDGWTEAQPRTRTCNLPARQCRTPPQTFFASDATRPSLTNPFPTHHHLLDHECPSGSEHEIHCVYTSPHVPRCIIPTTVKHNCCQTRVFPRNKGIGTPPALRLAAPQATAPGGVVVVVKHGSGMTSVKDEEVYADLPIDVRPMALDPQRDFDAVGWREYGAGQRNDLVNGRWICAGMSVDGVVGDLPSVMAACVDAATVAVGGREREESESFGDRHFYEDENVGDYGDDDDVMEADNDGLL